MKLRAVRRSHQLIAVFEPVELEELRLPAQASPTSVSRVRISVWVIKSLSTKQTRSFHRSQRRIWDSGVRDIPKRVLLQAVPPDSDDEQCRDPLLYESRCPAKTMRFTLFPCRDAMNIDSGIGGNAQQVSWATASSVSLPIFSVSTASATRLWRWTVFGLKNHTRI